MSLSDNLRALTRIDESNDDMVFERIILYCLNASKRNKTHVFFEFDYMDKEKLPDGWEKFLRVNPDMKYWIVYETEDPAGDFTTTLCLYWGDEVPEFERNYFEETVWGPYTSFKDFYDECITHW